MFPKLGQESLPTETPNDATAYYFVEMHKNFGEPKIYKGAITQPTTVQQALDESGAKKQFSSMTVDVHRKLPTGGVLKLPVGFKKAKQVKYEQDYALHPGDRIVVHPQSNSPFDKFVDNVLGKN